MHPANVRRRYIVTSSLIGWAHTQNNPWNTWHNDSENNPGQKPGLILGLHPAYERRRYFVTTFLIGKPTISPENVACAWVEEVYV